MEEKEKGKVCLRSCFASLFRGALQRKAASRVVSLFFACKPRSDNLCYEFLVMVH